MKTRNQRKAERREARKLARSFRTQATPTTRPPASDTEPCTCGGRYYIRLEGRGINIGHSEPSCDAIDAIDSAGAAEAFVHLQRRAHLMATERVYTVPWFPGMVCEMPGFVVAAVQEFIEVTRDLGVRRLAVYAAELQRRVPRMPDESVARTIYIADMLGIISIDEMPAYRGHVSKEWN